MTLVVKNPARGSRELAYVGKALEQGQLAIVPTDTVYGIAALASDSEACAHLAEVKGRLQSQPIAVLCADVDRVRETVPGLSVRANWALAALLPGPWTLIVANPERVFAHLCGDQPEAIGIRVPAHSLGLPPIAATSANLSGGGDPASVAEIDDVIKQQVACVIDRGVLHASAASTVLDLTVWEQGGGVDQIRVIRDAGGRAGGALAALHGAVEPE